MKILSILVLHDRVGGLILYQLNGANFIIGVLHAQHRPAMDWREQH